MWICHVISLLIKELSPSQKSVIFSEQIYKNPIMSSNKLLRLKTENRFTAELTEA